MGGSSGLPRLSGLPAFPHLEQLQNEENEEIKMQLPKREMNLFDISDFILQDKTLGSHRELGLRAIVWRILKFDGYMNGEAAFSKRWLAKELGVSLTTIRKACKRAVKVGYWQESESDFGSTKINIDWRCLKALAAQYRVSERPRGGSVSDPGVGQLTTPDLGKVGQSVTPKSIQEKEQIKEQIKIATSVSKKPGRGGFSDMNEEDQRLVRRANAKSSLYHR